MKPVPAAGSGGDARRRINQRRAEQTPLKVQTMVWEAQKRLCGRYRSLSATGKVKQQVTTAVA